MKCYHFLVLILTLLSISVSAQNNCSNPVAISSLPYSSGPLSTCGTVNDYASGSYCSSSNYGGGEDYVFTYTATSSGAHPVVLAGGVPGTDIWKIVSFHTACPPTTSNCVGGVTTSSSNTGSGSVNLTSGIQYYIFVDTWPTPNCAAFTLDISAPPPPPANDNCAGAIGLTVNSNLACTVTTNGTTVGATQSPDAAPTCSASGIDDDVWYSFVCTQATQQVKITAASNPCAIAVYSGACGSLAQISGACATTSSGTATLNFTGMTVGNTYYIRVYTTASSATNATFTMCVGTPPPPPTNDECVNAIAFPTIPTDQSCANVTANTANATQSIVGCTGTADDDVWYSFVCPTGYTTLLFLNTTVSGETDRVTQFYSGTCGNLTSILCSDPESGTVTGLVGGQTYYMRIYTYWSAVATQVTVCLKTPPPPPANDNCSGAIDLTVNSNLTCASTTNGTTVGATQSPDSAPTCSASGIDDDVWYSFVCTQVTQQVKITAASNPCAIAVYSGVCGSLAQISGACATTSSGTATLNFTGMTVGNTYYIRVYTTASSATNATFTMCVGTPPPPPANDNCAGAVSLTVNSDLACGATTNGTTVGATQSPDAAPTCSASSIDDDVWYSFVCTQITQQVKITAASNPCAIAVYSGTCGSLAQISGACATTSSGTATLNFTGMTVGNTYYIRVYTTASSATNATFTMCVGTPPPPPANDECVNAIAFPTIPTDQSCANVTANTAYATQSSVGCTGTADDDVWYSFVCPIGYSSLLFSNTTVSGETDRVTQFYSGTCGNLTSILCSDPESGTVTGLVGGQTYYMRIYSYYSAVSTQVTVCLKTPPPPPKTWVGGTGDWSIGSNWSPSGVPTCTDSVFVTNGVINLNGATAECRGLNMTAGTLNLNSGTLVIGVCGASDGGSRYFVQSGGTLNFSGATVTLNGGFTQTTGTLNFTAGSFAIDPNGSAGVYAVSNSCSIAGIFTMSGGTLNLPDASSTSGTVLYYNNSSNANLTGGTIVMGGGASSNVLNINTWVGSGRLAFYNLEINSGSNNTYVNSSSWSFGILNNLVISSGELRTSVGLYVNGNISNSGTLTATSTLYLANFTSGSVTSSPNNQVVSGAGVYRNATTKTAEFNALVINNAGSTGVTLDILDPSVSLGFTLTAGKVFGATGGQFTIWAKSGYAYTSGWIVGKLKRTISASGAATFHVGTSTTYFPATVTFGSNPAGSLTASFESGTPGNSGLPLTEASGTNPYLGADSLWAGGIWRLTTSDIGSTSYSFAATATGAPVNANTANVRVVKRADSGSSWNNPGTHIAGSGVVFSRSGLSGFSEFGIVRGAPAPLPLEFLSIKAVAHEGYNEILWATANEINTAWHEILRSPTGNSNYESIGKVAASANSSNTFSYTFTDKSPLAIAYYRIKTIDLDGSETMSNVASAERKVNDLLQVNIFPNPSSSMLNVQISTATSGELLLLVFDPVGKLVLRKGIDGISGNTSTSIDISHLPPGTYQMQISDTFKTMTRRFVKE